MKFLGLCGVLLAAGLATGGAKAQEAAAVKELIPTGKLRFGVAFAPKMSALFVVKDAGGSPRGVTVDLGNELAKRLGVPIEFMVAPNTGALTDALASAAIESPSCRSMRSARSDWNSGRPIASSKAPT
jgi:polar amino acid transport system substrate-binding protein